MDSVAKVKSKSTPTAGRSLFTTRDIGEGEEITRGRPFAAALDSKHLQHTCEHCFLWLPDGPQGGSRFDEKPLDGLTKLKACLGCRVVRYCTKVSLSSQS